MLYKTPVRIPFETKKIVRQTMHSGEVYICYTIGYMYNEAKKRSMPVRKSIGKMCQERDDMMYPNEHYYEIFLNEHPAENSSDPVYSEFLNTRKSGSEQPAKKRGRHPKAQAADSADKYSADKSNTAYEEGTANASGQGMSETSRINLERRAQGLPYWCNDPALFEEQHVYQDKMIEYNRTMATETDKRQQMLKEMFAEVGDECIVETPINSNWGCRHVHLGNGVYINSNVTFVDDADIYIGDSCLIAPNVVFATAGHPILPEYREKDYQYELPIHIGRNVWIGSGVQIMPGITIGDNSVIGAGSVVTKDIPANVVAYGVPCKGAREICERDREFYYRDRKYPADMSD